MNNFDILIEMLELTINETEHKDLSCIGPDGNDQLCLNFTNNPAVGKNLKEIKDQQEKEQKKTKRAEQAEKRKQTKENKKAFDKFTQENQLGLFDTNKEDKENGET